MLRFILFVGFAACAAEMERSLPYKLYERCYGY